MPSNIQLTPMRWLFLLKNMGSIKELLNTVFLFSLFSVLKPNLSQCKVAGIVLLKRVNVAVREIRCIGTFWELDDEEILP